MVSPGISPHLAPLTVAQQMFTIPGAVHAIIMTEEPPSLLPGVTNMATPLAAEVLAPPQALAQNMVSDTVRVDKKRPPEGAPDASDAQAHRDKRSRLDKTASNGDEHST
ncbi:hypothetical protein [Hydrogenophaga sp. BPS33]|uniref:hypothetical protein n=1 Tax=Hydrogenophaga sp. BPS33 TaxID=2651974 RepID=UPI00131FE913|nr:hypothetical protein [Hydrogenophaga sp. BPS33]QHE86955.1 hypothetical protein F9K07_19645 [Hydrogenophaga sp. BPS33]